MTGERENCDIERLCRAVIEENEAAWHDFKEGSAGALNYLVGQGVSSSGGRVDPHRIAETFRSLHTERGP